MAADPKYLILAVEESASSLGFYNPDSGREVGRVALSLWPHEIAVSDDGLAYVSNFGVRDYDLSLGYAGNSVSEIDVVGRNEKRRLFTRVDGSPYWGPHGVKLSPDQRYLYVNVERVLGIREPDLERPGSEYTKLLKIDRTTGDCVAALSIPLPAYMPSADKADPETSVYDVLPGTHNFVFSPHNSDEIWLFSGRGGVSVFSASTGAIIHRMQDFNGAVRSLSFGPKGTLLVSATNEVSLVDAPSRKILRRFGNLGVGQILYSSLTPDERFVLAPAVWEGQILVIDTQTGAVVHRLMTGIDPVQVVLSPDNSRAYVTHGRTQWLSYVDLKDLSRVAGQIKTRGGPNGLAFAPWSALPAKGTITLGSCLPFTGPFSAQGREFRLGLQYWQDRVNAAGGLTVDGKPHLVDVIYRDTSSNLDEQVLRGLARDLLQKTPIALMVGSVPSVADEAVGLETVSQKVPFLSGIGQGARLFDGTHIGAYSLAATAACRLQGVLLALKQRVSPAPATVCVVAADRSDLVIEAQATAAYAQSLGFQLLAPASSTGDLVLHPIGTTQWSQVLVPVSEIAPDLVIFINDQADAIAAVKACDTLGFRPGGIGITCDITNPVFKEKLGALAHGLLGTGWMDMAVHFAEDRFGGGSDFSREYFGEFSETPSELAAAGAAVGVVFEAALSSGCTASELTKTLESVDVDTFLTPVAFDRAGRNPHHEARAGQLIADGHALKTVPIWPLHLAGPRRPLWPR